jgi:hypothetical protein
MLRQLGSGPGSAHCAAPSTDHNGSLGTDDSSCFYDRSAHSYYNEGGGPRRNAGAANAQHAATNPERPGATGEPERPNSAVPNFNRDPDGAERSFSRPSAQRHDRRCA